jgi:ATP-dependent protease ClpP protease subunit
MKPLIIVITLIAAIFLFGWWAQAMELTDYNQVTLTRSTDPAPYCPVTKFSDNDKCLKCHVLKIVDDKPKFGLREIPISAGYDLPAGAEIVDYKGGLAIYFLNNGTGADRIKNIGRYMYRHPEFKRFIMEMHSGGGSVMDAWRAVGILEEMRCHGIEIETRCYGMAASAATVLLIAGDIGKRFVNFHAEIMLHKLWTFAMFKIDDPDTSEDQANLLRHFQDNINQFIFNRTGLDKSVLDKQMYKKDWWVTGREAIDLGIADGPI